MEITGTHFNYYHVCHRKLWLFAHGIQMEHTSQLVGEGKFIHETSYGSRANKYKELEIGGIKIDFYDPNNKVIHEVKKSKKVEEAHAWQLKYYIFILEKAGVKGVTGILDYPKLRKTDKVTLEEADKLKIEGDIKAISTIISDEKAPGKIDSGICKRCSYFDFCYSYEPSD